MVVDQDDVKQMERRKHNWLEIENDFITSDIPLTDIAKKYKVSRQAVSHHANLTNWRHRRDEYQNRVKDNLSIKAAESVALDKSQFDEKTNRVCDAVVESMAVLAHTLMGVERELAKTGKTLKLISAKESSEMLGAVRQAQEIKYRTLGVADKHEFKGDVKTITELSVTAQTMVDKVMGTPETRAAMAMALVPMKQQGGEMRAGGNGKSSGNGSDGADDSDPGDD